MVKLYGQTELIPYGIKLIHLRFHLFPGLLPEAMGFGLFESNRCSFLQRAHAAVADARVCGRYVLDQFLWTDQPADPPTRRIETFTARANRESTSSYLGREVRDAGEGCVV